MKQTSIASSWDVDRYTPLFQQHAATEPYPDNSTENNIAAKARLKAANAQVETDKAQITAATDAVQSARFAIATARINSRILRDALDRPNKFRIDLLFIT